MLRRIGLGLAAVFVALAVHGGTNVFRNPDLSITDGLGAPAGWTTQNRDASDIRARHLTNGTFELSSTTPTRGYYFQIPVKLLSKGKYRLTCEVNANMTNGAAFAFHWWNKAWNAEQRKTLPQQTGGKWVKVDWMLTAPDAKDDKTGEFYRVGFSGEAGTNAFASIRIRNLLLEPVTQEATAATRPIPVSRLEKLTARIVPIDPLLSEVNAKQPEMLFHYSGEVEGGATNALLTGKIDGEGEVSARLGSDHRAKLTFRKIRSGQHRLDVMLFANKKCIATNAYTFIATGATTERGPAGRKLNNMVTELLNKPLKDGEYRFYRPYAGWIWISLENAGPDARAYLDGSFVACVRPREAETTRDTMREVAAGWHKLRVAGTKGGTLRIHAVKRLQMPMWSVKRTPACDFTGYYKFNFAFVRRYLLPNMNSGSGKAMYRNEPDTLSYYEERGIRLYGGCPFIPMDDPDRNSMETFRKRLTAGPWKYGDDVQVDENSISDSHARHVIVSETQWDLFDESPSQAFHIFLGDATTCAFDDPSVHVSEISGVVNSGNGRGMLLPEVYAPATSKPEEGKRWFDLFARVLKTAEECVPAAKGHMAMHTSPFVEMGDWIAACPETDLKAHYSRQYRIFATDPRFASIGGFTGGAATHADEETRRWMAACYRHYAIEGRTNDLAEEYGFHWNPGFVKNPDFADGLNGWKVCEATGGGIRADSINRYGRVYQARQKMERTLGNAVAEFTATTSGANALVQTMHGFTPGKHYVLDFCVMNRANIVFPLPKKPTEPLLSAFSAQIDGGEIVKGLSYLHTTKKKFMHCPRYVFKALSPEITLTLSDRAEDGSAPAAGTKQVVNFVRLCPYFIGRDDSIGNLTAIISNNNRKANAK